MDTLREKIVDVLLGWIEPNSSLDNGRYAIADEILAIPEIAAGLRLKSIQDSKDRL